MRKINIFYFSVFFVFLSYTDVSHKEMSLYPKEKFRCYVTDIVIGRCVPLIWGYGESCDENAAAGPLCSGTIYG